MIPPILIRLLIPRRLRPFVDRMLAGAGFGMCAAVVIFLTLKIIFGQRVMFLGLPVLAACFFGGLYIAWRTRPRR